MGLWKSFKNIIKSRKINVDIETGYAKIELGSGQTDVERDRNQTNQGGKC